MESYFGIPWTYVAIELLQAFPALLVYAYFCTRLFDITHVKGFVAGEVVLMLVIFPFHHVVSPGVPRALMGIALYGVLPLLLSRGRLSRRLVTFVLMYVALALAEFPSMFLWFVVAGGQAFDYEHMLVLGFTALFVLDLFYALMQGLMLYGVERALRRFAGWGSAADDGASAPLSQGAQRNPFVMYAAFELVLAFAFMAIIYDTGNWDLGNLCLGVFLCALSLAAMVVVYIAATHYAEKRRLDARAELLQEQAEGYLEGFKPIYRRIAAISKLRHDTRNHVQVTSFLIRAGRLDEAAAYLAEFRGELESAAGDSGDVGRPCR